MKSQTPGAPRDTLPAGVVLWLFDCDRYAEQLLRLEQSDTVLPPSEREHAARLSDDLMRRRWICARVALRRALGAWAGIAFEKRAFEITSQGRPFLAAPAPQFSLSHAGPYALAAISGSAAIGADIEPLAPRKISRERRQRLEAFAERLCASPLPDASEARFIQAWCRIEAVAKAEGCGVGRLLTRAGLMGSGGEPAGEARAERGMNSVAGSTTVLRAADLVVGDLAPGFAAAIAGSTPQIVAASCDVLRPADGGAVLLSSD